MKNMQPQTRNELRCFCRRTPLLAVYGLDKHNKLYVHVKVFKNRRVYGEILVTKGDIKVRCRECMRWHTIEISSGNAQLIETSAPELLSQEVMPGHV